jgi:NADPH-dependent curcumin reductase CurA
MSVNQRVVYARKVIGVPSPEDFELDSVPVSAPESGQFLVENLYLSLEPYYRNVMKGMPIYGPPLKPGDVMFGETLGRVVASRHDGFAAGDLVIARGGWQQFALLNGINVRKVAPSDAPLSAELGVLGTPGLTGYVGIVYLAPPRPGQTVVVSAATGPVGSTVGQTARLMGARVVGIAGTAAKCAYAIHELGFDDCVNYKDGDLKASLKGACPEGIDVYFDNVGGETLAAVLANLALHAQVVLCGMMGVYNHDVSPPGPHLGPVVVARAVIKGLVVYDHFSRFPELKKVVGAWIRDGKFKYREDVSQGLAQAPDAFCRLMRGENFGKALVQVT